MTFTITPSLCGSMWIGIPRVNSAVALLGRVSQQCPRAVARAKEVAASVELRPDTRCVGLLRPQRWRTCIMFITSRPTHRIPGHTSRTPEHPLYILQCLLRGPIPHITLSHIPCLQFRASPPPYRPRLILLPHPQEEHAPHHMHNGWETTCM